MSAWPRSSSCWRRGAEVLWPVTLLGAVAGWALASIPGALLGGLLGQVLDRRLKLQSWASLRNLLGSQRLGDDELQFMLLGRLAKCDGRVLQVHIQQARQEMQRLRLDGVARQRAMDAFGRGKRLMESFEEPLLGLRRRPERAEVLLRSCWRMASADGRVSEQEHRLIRQWGSWLGWTAEALTALADEYEPSRRVPEPTPADYQAALRLLGVQGSSEAAVIKRAYRKLLSQHHPDKLAGAGATPAQIRAATERTRELHQAYELIRLRRGFR